MPNFYFNSREHIDPDDFLAQCDATEINEVVESVRLFIEDPEFIISKLSEKMGQQQNRLA